MVCGTYFQGVYRVLKWWFGDIVQTQYRPKKRVPQSSRLSAGVKLLYGQCPFGFGFYILWASLNLGNKVWPHNSVCASYAMLRQPE